METVRVIYHHEPDGWWAESPDVEGWSGAAATFEEMKELAEEGVRFALERDVRVDHLTPESEQAA